MRGCRPWRRRHPVTWTFWARSRRVRVSGTLGSLRATTATTLNSHPQHVEGTGRRAVEGGSMASIHRNSNYIYYPWLCLLPILGRRAWGLSRGCALWSHPPFGSLWVASLLHTAVSHFIFTLTWW